MNDESNATLLRIEQLVRGLLRVSVSEKLAEIRTDKTLREIYELTGVNDITRIAKKVSVSTGKVSGIWKSWEEAGLIVKVGKSYEKLLD